MSQTLTPEVTWAQRSSDSDPERNYLYVNIKVAEHHREECLFQGHLQEGRNIQRLPGPLCRDRPRELQSQPHRPRRRARSPEEGAQGGVLARLLESKQKMHFLKTNFDKWVDEDEQDEAGEDDYANNFGGFGGEGGGDPSAGAGGLGNIDFSKLGGMPGMGGMGGMPDLSALAGGMGGMPGMGGLPGGEDAEEDDDDLPELEEAEGQKSTKIQEVS
ncbi:HSP20-like chaperone [Penicillium expansum]|nr:HSP20-like chaperone [Penicillium expansum]